MTCTSLKQPGYVYVMQCRSIYKIGSSLDPDKRLKGFGSDSIIYKNRRIYVGQGTVIIRRYAVVNMLEAERHLQATFHAKRIREPGKGNRREWFALDTTDIEYIDKLMANCLLTNCPA